MTITDSTGALGVWCLVVAATLDVEWGVIGGDGTVNEW